MRGKGPATFRNLQTVRQCLIIYLGLLFFGQNIRCLKKNKQLRRSDLHPSKANNALNQSKTISYMIDVSISFNRVNPQHWDSQAKYFTVTDSVPY